MNTNNFKKISIGSLIQKRVGEMQLGSERICNFLNCSEEEVHKMYNAVSLDSLVLLRWSKLLDYDFFRLYSQHLILYAPASSHDSYHKPSTGNTTKLPVFRKKIYTKEVIDFILELIDTGEKTKIQIIDEYKIPKTTLYKWIKKYKMIM